MATNDSTGGKGRPTPKRKESESKRVISSLAPVTTKDEKAKAKEAARHARAINRIAYLRGDENALPARDRGPARRFVRTYVDSRRSVGEYFLPIIFVVLILTIIPIPTVQFASVALMYSVLLVAVVDGIFLAKRVKKEVAQKFPGTNTRGLGMYAWLRSTQMRRLRAPKPQVSVGNKNF